jgi:DNA-binding transcriptional regulator YhcF (GntR family)
LIQARTQTLFETAHYNIMKKAKLLTINSLADKTGVDRQTVRRRLAKAGMLADRSGWTMAEALPLIVAGRPSSNLEAARLKLTNEQCRKTKAEADLAEAKHEILLKRWCPIEGVTRIWDNTLIILRNKIAESTDLPQQLKIDILADLKQTLAAEYLNDAPFTEQEGPLGSSSEE